MTDRKQRLAALADRIEQLQGPDRGVDADIELATGNWTPEAHEAWWNYEAAGESANPPMYAPVPPRWFTSSIDAALTLAEEGFGSLISGKYPDGRVGYVAVVTYPARAEAEGFTKATTFAAAALRAQSEMVA